jgi:hypothetical protein
LIISTRNTRERDGEKNVRIPYGLLEKASNDNQFIFEVIEKDGRKKIKTLPAFSFITK